MTNYIAPVLLFAALFAGSAEAQDKISVCVALSGADVSRTPDAPAHITAASEIAAADKLPAHCKVEGYITPTIGFELRLPMNAWNGKMMFQGCGGMCGSLTMIAMCDDALARGYACVHTDLGHRSTFSDAKWAYNNPQGEIDFYFRATHATAQVAKAILGLAYGKPPERAYYKGCSTGGRQGLISAQRFPDDFDGIIVGAPAGVSAGGGLHLIWSALANLDNNGKGIMPSSKVPMLAEAVMDKCDGIDGLEDGLIDDPRRCNFDPAELACKRGQNTSQCLTEAEIGVVRKLYSGALDSNGHQIYTATPMFGSEPTWVPFLIGENGQKPYYYYFGGDFFRYLAFADDPGPSWAPEDFDFDRDPPRMGYNRHLNNAADPDLRAFKARGGKMIAYQGWRDYSVPPMGVVDYYENVGKLMGGAAATEDFFRLFMLPGVDHCAGGAGPSRMDVITALENWVERGTPPDALTAYKLTTDPGMTGTVHFPVDASDVQMSRPVYPFPAVARYRGEGSPDRSENFTKVNPN